MTARQKKRIVGGAYRRVLRDLWHYLHGHARTARDVSVRFGCSSQIVGRRVCDLVETGAKLKIGSKQQARFGPPSTTYEVTGSCSVLIDQK